MLQQTTALQLTILADHVIDHISNISYQAINLLHAQCAAIHGDISQGQRTAAVEGFKAGTVPLLIATDVAARGLDIPDVEVGAQNLSADSTVLSC